MEEQNTSPSEKQKKENEKEPAKEKKSLNVVFKELAGTFKGEFSKIIWPSRADLLKQTTTVIITSLLFGVIIFGMDSVFGYGYQVLLKLLG